ncbi:hypothetical protein SUDANB95_07132 [Actinosynnema sp. ALI-1.44]
MSDFPGGRFGPSVARFSGRKSASPPPVARRVRTYDAQHHDEPGATRSVVAEVAQPRHGCGSSRGVPVALFSGAGTVECTREQFAGAAVHAPRLTFNRAGEITEIAGRYHP